MVQNKLLILGVTGMFNFKRAKSQEGVSGLCPDIKEIQTFQAQKSTLQKWDTQLKLQKLSAILNSNTILLLALLFNIKF